MKEDSSLAKNQKYGDRNKKIIPFQRDINYYYQKGNQYFLKNDFKKATLFFKKTVELEPENSLNHYNLACLLSKAGQLEEANSLFAYIIEDMDPSLAECYFLMAINYGLMDNLEQARQHLHLYLQHQPEGDMALEARELLAALDQDESNMESYNQDRKGDHQETDNDFEEIKQEILTGIKQSYNKDIKKAYEQSQDYRLTLKKILYFGYDIEKEKVIEVLGKLKHKHARETLLEFLRNPWIKDRLKYLVMLKLKNTQETSASLQVYLDGKSRELNIHKHPLVAPRWHESWEKVLLCAIDQVRRNKCLNNENILETIQAVWINYLNKTYPQIPRISKPEVWAAGLEYSLVKHFYLDVTQQEISNKYGVSQNSLRDKYRLITNAVEIKNKLENKPCE